MASRNLIVGDLVEKRTGDYTFDGIVCAVIIKRSGARRVAVENDAGMIHIFSESQLQLKE